MYRGYIKLWRKLQDSDIWTQDKFTRGQAWLDLLMLANHKPTNIRIRGVKIFVDRGTLAWSELSLSNRWKWSRGKTRRFLQELSSNSVQQIEQQKNNVTSLIKIINYEQYQGEAPEAVQQTDTKQDTKRDTDNNVKNVKNVKNKEKDYISKNLDEQNFSRFWESYPRKVGKQACLKIWIDPKKKKIRPAIKNILKALEIQKASEDWTKEDGRYIPNPATWLNQGRWDDELKKPSKDKQQIQPTTYAQAQDAERRTMVKMIKGLKNDGKSKSDNRSIIKT